jgi:hypothetical protein
MFISIKEKTYTKYETHGENSNGKDTTAKARQFGQKISKGKSVMSTLTMAYFS